MDEVVARSLAKWPNVPAVYGWLALDRRGNWLIKGERIGNAALREFIARNYAARRARPLVLPERPAARLRERSPIRRSSCTTRASALFDHCGRPFAARETFLDDEGSVLIEGGGASRLLDDRDLERYAEIGDRLAAHPRAPRSRRRSASSRSPQP